jgi:hypothetical protein
MCWQQRRLARLLVAALTLAACVQTQDHMYGNPMVDVKWHTAPGGERRVISSDTRIVKIWCACAVRRTIVCKHQLATMLSRVRSDV